MAECGAVFSPLASRLSPLAFSGEHGGTAQPPSVRGETGEGRGQPRYSDQVPAHPPLHPCVPFPGLPIRPSAIPSTTLPRRVRALPLHLSTRASPSPLAFRQLDDGPLASLILYLWARASLPAFECADASCTLLCLLCLLWLNACLTSPVLPLPSYLSRLTSPVLPLPSCIFGQGHRCPPLNGLSPVVPLLCLLCLLWLTPPSYLSRLTSCLSRLPFFQTPLEDTPNPVLDIGGTARVGWRFFVVRFR